MNKYGGKVIGIGSFGAVFKPAIKCKNEIDSKHDDDYISKLMTKKEANVEYDIIIHIRKILSRIPDYEKYFLLDHKKCEPTNITDEDKEIVLVGKESALRFIKEYESNQDNYIALNMSYGGVEMNKYIDELLRSSLPYLNFMIKYTIRNDEEFQYYLNRLRISGKITVQNSLLEYIRFRNVNTNLIELLKRIRNMNELGVYHFDIKPQNILIRNDIPILIDWSLSFVNPNEDNINQFYHNAPISTLIIKSTEILSSIEEHFISMEKYSYDYSKDKICRTFAQHFANHIYKHYLTDVEYINKRFIHILNYYLKKDHRIPKSIYYDIYYDILHEFIEGTNFNYKTLFEITLHNFDIYSLILSYMCFLYNEKWDNAIQIRIAMIIRKYCFNSKYYTEKYDIEQIINELNDLNNLIPKVISDELQTDDIKSSTD